MTLDAERELSHLGRLNFASPEDLRQLSQLSTPVWIFDVDRHGIWWANKQGLAFWKAKSVDALRKRDFSSDSATVRARLRQIVELASSDAHVTDTWTLYPGGHPQTVMLSFQPVEIEDHFKGILIELVQVLDRTADDDTWRLHEAARATSLIMTTFSLEGGFLAQNPASLACYEVARRDGGKLTDLASRFVNEHDVEFVLEKVAGNEAANWEAEVITSNGIRTHSISVQKGRDPITGDFVIVLNEEDVTERARIRALRETEKEALKHQVAQSSDKLRISQERYELAVETAALWDWDVLEDKLFMSPNFLNALGYEQADFIDILRLSGLIGLLHPDDVRGYQKKIATHLANPDQKMSHEIRFVSKSGDIIWFHCQGKCVHDGAGKVTRSVGLLTDITQRKSLEAKLLVSQRLEAIGQLTGGIAHDFNNLLTVIQGNAELLEVVMNADTELTGEIIRAVQRGADLTTHLLAFAKQQTLIPKSVDLNRLIPEMEKTLFRAISETVSIEYVADSDLWDVHADPTQLETALLNLALNARDAMPSGGTLKITCRNMDFEQIENSEELELTPGEYVEIALQDDGPGMPENTLRKAFEPFFTTKGVGEGSGLGLSMVLGFSRQSRGDTQISSIVGQGTKVTFYLPKSAEARPSVAQPHKADVLLGNGERVHILEDNQLVQKTVSKIVGSLGYQVTTSNDTAEALVWARGHPETELYLVDVLLPGGKSGVDFVKLLKAKQPDAKVLFMSGYSENQLAESSGLKLDGAFISKPFEKSTFSRAIRTALNMSAHPSLA
ncbi:ATP-binding protein [Litoreibacter sp.]|nr:ATP-binding protein [Litoreibacter sp.]